jgi:hypothetical protein
MSGKNVSLRQYINYNDPSGNIFALADEKFWYWTWLTVGMGLYTLSVAISLTFINGALFDYVYHDLWRIYTTTA